MSISEREAERLDAEFQRTQPALCGYSKKSAQKFISAWYHLFRIMEREKKMTDHLGIGFLDWQIVNWANDAVDLARGANLYEDLIRINKQILAIHWDDDEENLMHENAKREIADAYAGMGRMDECLRLYEEYLKEDPLWGWGWIGYFRQLKNANEERFQATLDDLFQKIESGTEFRDLVDLLREMGDEVEELGNQELADRLHKQGHELYQKKRQASLESMRKLRAELMENMAKMNYLKKLINEYKQNNP